MMDHYAIALKLIEDGENGISLDAVLIAHAILALRQNPEELAAAALAEDYDTLEEPQDTPLAMPRLGVESFGGRLSGEVTQAFGRFHDELRRGLQ
jgi:hypothetical protein